MGQRFAFLMMMALCICALHAPCFGGAPGDAGRFVGEDHERLFYAVEGEGCPIVLIGGGSAMDSRQWEEAGRLLGDGVMSIRFDPRGTGRSDPAKSPFSDADDLAGVLDALGLDRAVIAGNSSAGAVAIEFALAYPDRTRGVVAIAPFIDGWKFSGEMQERVDRIAVAFASGAQQFIHEIFFDHYFIPAPRDPSARGRARVLIEEGYDKMTSADASLLRTPDSPLIERVGEVEVPVLLVAGTLDHPDVQRRIDYLDEAIGDSRVFKVEGSGHTPTLEAPDTLARGIREFLDSLNRNSPEGCRPSGPKDGD